MSATREIRRNVIRFGSGKARATRSEPWRRGATYEAVLDCGHEVRLRGSTTSPPATHRCRQCERVRNRAEAEARRSATQ